MSADQVVRVVNEQRKRCQAAILGAAEASAWWRRLTKDEQVAFRAKVLDSIAVFYDLTRDVLKTVESDTVLHNEHALRLLVDLNQRVGSLISESTER